MSEQTSSTETFTVLEYVALIILLIVLVLVFYTFIYLHELPYETAKHRNHPQQEAIYVACWLSLFTLHAIWPIVFIWAIAKPKPIQVSIAGDVTPGSLGHRLEELELRLRAMEARATIAENGVAAAVDRKTAKRSEKS